MTNEKETAGNDKPDPDEKKCFDPCWYGHVERRWIEMCTLRKYFESLKVRDLIVGRIALFLLLSVSILTIAVPSLTADFYGKIIVSFVTAFSTVALYWVGNNGYVLSVAGLFNMIIDKNFSPLKNFGDINEEEMRCVEEQKLLLSNYAADCPDLTLLHVLHGNRTKKDTDDEYRRLANSPRFREKLKVNCFMFILAHFFACENIADEKIRVMATIDDIVRKVEDKED